MKKKSSSAMRESQLSSALSHQNLNRRMTANATPHVQIDHKQQAIVRETETTIIDLSAHKKDNRNTNAQGAKGSSTKKTLAAKRSLSR